MASVAEKSSSQLPSDWYAQLFESGLFADATITYGAHHDFNVHSVILCAKSTWFAKHWNGRAKFHEDGISHKVLALFSWRHITPRSVRDSDNTMYASKIFGRVLMFCYTGKYNVPSGQVSSYARCSNHMLMYFVGKHYGIDSILQHAVEAFNNDAGRLRKESQDMIIDLINIAYDLPGLGDDDRLREAARGQAKLLANAVSIPIHQQVVEKELRKEVLRMLPKAGDDLYAHGYKPLVLATQPNKAIKDTGCIRCQTSITRPDDMARLSLCDTCASRPISSINMSIPKPFIAMGMSLALWQCHGCDELWKSEAQKTQSIRLEECPACRPVEGRVKRTTMKSIEWACAACRAVWHCSTTEQTKLADLEACICCPSGGLC